MAAIGDGPTEVWTAELRRTGRVVFPLRRQPLLRQTRSAFILLILLAIADLPHALKTGGALRIVAIVVTTAVLIGLSVSGWKLVTRRPTLTVDTTGVRRGRRRFVSWSEVDTIDELDGPPGDRSFAVVSNARRRKLRLDQQHVRNVVAFRNWLVDLLEEHRRTAPR
ncbi:hypothetical protein [Kribbella sp. NPDC049584]|uniref:hypothetical protein n=1 Tax=Kribbella sp. NPDC049584 TaxID=3154833 RepID=UPI003433F5A0